MNIQRLYTIVLSAALVVGAGACKHAESSQQAAVESPAGTGQEIAAKPEEAKPAVAQPGEAKPEPVAAPAALVLPKGVDGKDLDATEKKLLAEILVEQFDPCGKSRSFAQSLDAGDCPLALKLANALVGHLQAGQGKKQAVALLLRDIERLNTIVDVPTAGSPLIGSAQSKAVVIEFSDFECPFCRRAEEPLLKMQKHYGFALYYKFFPLKVVHPNAEGAARAAWAASQQGKFWELAAALFKADPLDWPAIQKLAHKISGLDFKKFADDYASDKAKAAVEADIKAGDAAGIDGTPTFFVNGRRAESLSQVQELVRDQVQAAGETMPPPISAEDLGEAAPAAPGGKPSEAAGAAKPATAPEAPAPAQPAK